MTDIFQEVDEEVRRERMQALWKRYGNLIVTAAFLVVAGVGGWRGYEWWEAQKAAEAGAAFEVAVGLAEQGKHAEAEAAFAKLVAGGTSGYRTLARFREAEQVGLRDSKAALAAYDALAADSRLEPVLQDLAAMRAALILVDDGTFEEMRSRLEPLADKDRPFRHSARELLALAAWRAGDATATRRWIDAVINDAETPAGIRTRVEVLMALTATDGKG